MVKDEDWESIYRRLEALRDRQRPQPPSPTATPPPPHSAVLQTLLPELWGSLFRLRGLLIDRVDSIDEFDFHFNGIFENTERDFGIVLKDNDDLSTVREAAMRHAKILITPPTTPQTDTGTQTTPPTTPPTPKPKLIFNSVSTNTDPPPTRTYAEAATTTTSPSLRQPPTDKGKAPAKATAPRPPPPERTKIHHPCEYKPWYFTRLQQNTNPV
ncbi:hypothetical protein BGX38DRAFT_1278779 [Terfezia claveryi]|nr:hypothetical protein BGX38DRAFT_1278779 [Terfezia claveryi]